jgi:DNA-binding FadR family transcriptional regulator
VIDMHRAIRDRVAEHDPAAAQQAMHDHLDHVQATYGRQAPELA